MSLVLSRKLDEQIVIGGNIVITVVGVGDRKVRIGVDAPKDITVDRHEVHVAKQATLGNATGDEQQLHRVGKKLPPVKPNPYLMFPRKTAVRRHAG